MYKLLLVCVAVVMVGMLMFLFLHQRRYVHFNEFNEPHTEWTRIFPTPPPPTPYMPTNTNEAVEPKEYYNEVYEEVIEVVTLPILFPNMPYSANPQTLELLLNGERRTLPVLYVYGYNYISLEKMFYLLGVYYLDIDMEMDKHDFESGYYNEGNDYFRICEISQLLDIRLNWIESRQTLIMDTSLVLNTDEPIFTSEPLPEEIIQLIMGSSFHDNTPFPTSHLAYLTITHANFYGQSQIGHLIIAASIADEVLDIFREIYEARFPIERMRLIDFYDASDYYSMADNNSVGFNFRYIAGTRTISRHGLGMAIDINPIQNPYQRGDTIWPIAGTPYLDRTNVRPGMIIHGDVVHQAFVSRGWIWGGSWRSPLDFHHFERH